MPRLCCISRKKRQSFPIHEKQRKTEVNKVFIRHVGNIRLTPSPPLIQPLEKKTQSRATVKTERQVSCKPNTSDQQSINKTNSRTSLDKIFQTPSPIPKTISDIPEENHVNTSSSWSASTEHKKNSKHRPCTESYDVTKETIFQHKNLIKSSGKSKLVLENVKKMINKQNIQQQKDSAYL